MYVPGRPPYLSSDHGSHGDSFSFCGRVSLRFRFLFRVRFGYFFLNLETFDIRIFGSRARSARDSFPMEMAFWEVGGVASSSWRGLKRGRWAPNGFSQIGFAL